MQLKLLYTELLKKTAKATEGLIDNKIEDKITNTTSHNIPETRLLLKRGQISINTKRKIYVTKKRQ